MADDDQNSDNQLFGEHLDPPELLGLQQSIVNIYPSCSIIYNVAARAFMIPGDPFIHT